MKAVIRVKNLRKNYGAIRAVNGISFEVFEGEVFGIVGPNGAGKTTTVECVEGLRLPDKGTISVLGLTPGKDGKKLKEKIGVQLQEGKLPDRIKVGEALDLFAALYRHSLPWQPILESLGLSDKIDSHFDTLSGGQKQRLFIAISLINDPRVVFFDELTTGLDPQARRAMWNLVAKIRAEGKTVVLVTHFMEEAERLCDRVAIIDEGQIIALGTPSSLVQRLEAKIQIVFSVRSLAAGDSLINKLERINGVSRIQQNEEQIVVHGQDDGAVNEVIKVLTGNNAWFYDFSIKRPSLEDVFLSLTGQKMRG